MDPDALTIQPRPADMPHNTRAVDSDTDSWTCVSCDAPNAATPRTGNRWCHRCGRNTPPDPAPPQDAGAGEYRPEIEALIDAVKVWAIAGWRQPDALAVHGPLYAAVESAADALQAQYARSERAREELQQDKEQLDRAWKVAIAEAQDQWGARKRLAQRANLMPCPECRGAGEHLDFFRSGQSCASCRGACYVPFDERAFDEVFWEPYSSAPSTPGEEKAG